MKRTYKTILKHLEREHEGMWALIHAENILQTRWIKHLRWGLNMSARQLGKRMGMSAHGVRDMEQREMEGNITLATLQKAANAFEMDLFYLFVPKKGKPVNGALQAMIEERAKAIATQIVNRTAQTMVLEDQGTGQAAIDDDIKELTAELVQKQPSSLWE